MTPGWPRVGRKVLCTKWGPGTPRQGHAGHGEEWSIFRPLLVKDELTGALGSPPRVSRLSRSPSPTSPPSTGRVQVS